jgi:hypothetical protein
VRFVRLTLLSPLAPSSDWIDASELEVFGSPPNQLPAGTLAASRLRVTAGESVSFAASFSDPDSRITGYDWDFDGDGSVDRSTATPSTSFTYGSAGDFDARVLVRDFRGGAGSATREVAVSAPPRPTIRLPKRGTKGRVTVRVICTQRCSVTGRLRVGRRTIRTVRRTFVGDRRVTLTLPKKVRRAHRRRGNVKATLSVSARYGAGPRRTADRTLRIRF